MGDQALRSGRLGTGPRQKTPCLEMALGPGGRVRKASARELPCHLTRQKGSEKRRSVLLLGPRGQNTQSCMASALTRGGWGALMGKSRGPRGRQWLRLGGHRALGRGTLPVIGQAEKWMLPAPRPILSLFHPQWVEAGGRQTDLAKPFSSSFGDKSVAASGRVRALGATRPRATAAGTGPTWPPWPSSMAPHKGATEPPPLPPFLHPRLGAKDFKFWLRCSSRGH